MLCMLPLWDDLLTVLNDSIKCSGVTNNGFTGVPKWNGAITTVISYTCAFFCNEKSKWPL